MKKDKPTREAEQISVKNGRRNTAGWPEGHKIILRAETESFLPCRKVLCISLSAYPISSFPKLSQELQVSFLYHFLEKIESMERNIRCESKYRKRNDVSSYLQ